MAQMDEVSLLAQGSTRSLSLWLLVGEEGSSIMALLCSRSFFRSSRIYLRADSSAWHGEPSSVCSSVPHCPVALCLPHMLCCRKTGGLLYTHPQPCPSANQQLLQFLSHQDFCLFLSCSPSLVTSSSAAC